MAKAKLKSIQFSLTDLPAYNLPEASQPMAEHISHYLYQVLEHPAYVQTTSIQIPSISDLAVFFKSPYLTIYDALRSLRQQGYDYALSQFNQPVLIRRVSVVSPSRQRRNS